MISSTSNAIGPDDHDNDLLPDDGVLTVFYWHEDPDDEDDSALWWEDDDYEGPTEGT